jgi:type I restriction enzyme S subunit
VTEHPKKGWTRVAFGDVVRLCRERSSDPEADGLERYVGLDHLEPGDLKIRRWGDVADGTTFTNVFRSGQVLFGKRRAYQRKVAVADFDGVCSGDIYVFEPNNERLLPELLPFICQTDGFFEHAVGTSAGSLSPRTNWESLASYEFALPPLKEQRGIADVLSSTETACQALSALRKTLVYLRRASLVDYFDRLIADNSVRKIPVGEAGDVLMGRQRSPAYESGPFMRPYLRVANVFDGYIDISDTKQMQFSESEYQKFRLLSGDVLLNEGQSRELVGRSAIFRDELPGSCFQNTLIRFRPTHKVTAEYAHRYFQYCLYTGRFVAIAKQTTSIAHLGVLRFAKMLMPLPARKTQQDHLRIASATEGRLNDTDRRYAELRKLAQRISARALSCDRGRD